MKNSYCQMALDNEDDTYSISAKVLRGKFKITMLSFSVAGAPTADRAPAGCSAAIQAQVKAPPHNQRAHDNGHMAQRLPDSDAG